ncbi:MAG: hypothetical protein EXR53_05845 [Dehalococcoidia bacterium]|nr:hypothetical protein [Dehalococcoidia bacterium]
MLAAPLKQRAGRWEKTDRLVEKRPGGLLLEMLWGWPVTQAIPFVAQVAMKPFFLLLLVACSSLLLVGCIGSKQFAATAGWAGPLVSDETVYLGSREGKMLALDAATGERRVSFPAGEKEHLLGIYGTPALAGGVLFVGDYQGKLYALDAAGLTKRWQYPADERKIGQIVGGPTVAGNLVIFGSSDKKVRALLRNNGAQEWEFATEGMVWSAPIVVSDTVYVASLGHHVYALSLADGKPKWPKPFEAGGAVVASPLVADGKVFFGSFDRVFYAVNAATGKEVWRFGEGKAWYWSTPVTDGKRVYPVATDGKVYALDINSGAKRWEFDLGKSTISAPVLVGNNMVVTSDAGLIYILSAETGAQVSSFDVAAQVRAPLIARDGVVYINAMNHRVWALRVSGRQEKVWEISTSTKE